MKQIHYWGNDAARSREAGSASRNHAVVDKLGISRKGRRVGLHAFRHTVAGMLLQTAGADVAQRQFRHADPATTLGIYGHVLGDDRHEAKGQIESVLSKPAVERYLDWLPFDKADFPHLFPLRVVSSREAVLGAPDAAPNNNLCNFLGGQLSHYWVEVLAST